MGIHIEGYGDWNSKGSSGQWVPSGSVEQNNFRYISINGSNSLSHGLVMSGNTPLSVRTPKTSSVQIPYSHGSVDLSKADGRLYFNERNLRYAFAAFIERDPTDTLSIINQSVQSLYSELENWLYVTPSNQGSTLTDCGISYTMVKCTGIEISKNLFPEHWVLTVTITFVADPFNSVSSYNSISPGLNMLDENTRDNMRYIEFDEVNTLSKNMVMSGNTPLSNLTAKRDTIEINYGDGVIDASSSVGVFYEDRKISYQFLYFMECGANSITNNYNAQVCVEKVMYWLYNGWGKSLYDSGLGMTLGKARPTSFSVDKQITNHGYWILRYNIEFTVYPIVDNGDE